MRSELRSAFRVFTKSPMFAATVLATIALGIGPGSAVFSVVDTVLLRPLPYPEPERLVRIWGWDKKADRRYLELSASEFRMLRDDAKSFTVVVAFSNARRSLADTDGRATRVTTARITKGFLSLLGASFARGRGFSDEEFRQQKDVVILSYDFWRARYGGQPDIVGTKIFIRQAVHDVVGVLAADQRFPQDADVLKPIKDAEMSDNDRELLVLGRLRPGVGAEQANDEAASLVQRAALRDVASAGRFTAWTQPLRSMLVKDIRAVLLMLLAAVSLVVVMASVNVASLLLARAGVRRREMAIRAALGAGRRRLAMLCLTESLALAGAGGLLGLAVGQVLLRVMITMVPPELPRLARVGLDARATVIIVGVTLVCGLLFGLAPALIESRQDLRFGTTASRSGTFWPAGAQLRHVLVVAQIVMSMAMIAGATQVAGSFRHLLDFDRGFRNVHLLEIRVGSVEAASKSAIIDRYNRLQARTRSIAGVAGVEMANFSAMDVRSFRLAVQVEGTDSARPPVQVSAGVVSTGYFSAIGLPVLAGRDFAAERDYAGAEPVAIVNEAFAETLVSGNTAVGRRVKTPGVTGGSEIRRIVGVVADLKPEVQLVAAPAIYMPFGQEVWPDMHLLISMPGRDPAIAVPVIREQIWADSPTVVLDNIGTLEDKVARTLVAPRFNAAVVSVLAGVALVLAAVGLYGLLSQFVWSRRRELAIRRAVGAGASRIVMLVVAQGLMLTAAGLTIGLPAALAASRLLSSLLYEVRWTDASAFVLSAIIIVSVGALACLIPAFRAVRINPVTALRDE